MHVGINAFNIFKAEMKLKVRILRFGNLSAIHNESLLIAYYNIRIIVDQFDFICDVIKYFNTISVLSISVFQNSFRTWTYCS